MEKTGFIEELKRNVKGELLIGEAIPEKFLTDFVGALKGRADVYLKAADREDIVSAVRAAYRFGASVVVRSGGTNLVGSTVPDGGLVLDVSGLNRILEFDRDNLTITVEPGVVLRDLIAFVEARGLMYPPDPAEKLGTIGGNVSTNAGGMRAVKYGVTRDYVLSLELVTPSGEIVALGAKVRKDTSGLNLKQLVIGSEGTLGVITEVTLRLVPLPEFSESVLLAFGSLDEGVRCVNAVIKANLDPTAIEFQEKKVIALGERYIGKEFPLPQASAYLVVTLDGKKEEVAQRLQKLLSLAGEKGAIGTLTLDDPETAKTVWEIRGALARAVDAAGVWEPVDSVVPIARISDFVGAVDKISREEKVRIVAFGHAGDGNVHLCVIRDQIPESSWPDVLNRTLSLIYQKVYELGGRLSGEHGIGKGKRRYFLACANPLERRLMNEVKRAIDTRGIFNPHDGYCD